MSQFWDDASSGLTAEDIVERLRIWDKVAHCCDRCGKREQKWYVTTGETICGQCAQELGLEEVDGI